MRTVSETRFHLIMGFAVAGSLFLDGGIKSILPTWSPPEVGLTTFVLGLIFSGSMKTAGAIAGTEVVTKIVLFYGHERLWALVRWGHRPHPAPDQSGEG